MNDVKNHSPEQIQKLVKSLEKLKQVKPIVVAAETGQVLAGKGVVLALMEMGKKKVQAIMIEGMSLEDQKAYIVADNRIAEDSTWIYASIKQMFDELELADYDVSVTGFDDGEMNLLGDMDLSWMNANGDDEEETTVSFTATKAKPGYSSLEFVVKSEYKAPLMAVIREAKERMNCDTDGDALTLIINSYRT